MEAKSAITGLGFHWFCQLSWGPTVDPQLCRGQSHTNTCACSLRLWPMHPGGRKVMWLDGFDREGRCRFVQKCPLPLLSWSHAGLFLRECEMNPAELAAAPTVERSCGVGEGQQNELPDEETWERTRYNLRVILKQGSCCWAETRTIPLLLPRGGPHSLHQRCSSEDKCFISSNATCALKMSESTDTPVDACSTIFKHMHTKHLLVWLILRMSSAEFFSLNADSLSRARLLVGYNVCFQGKHIGSALSATVLPADDPRSVKKQERSLIISEGLQPKTETVPRLKHVYLILNNEGLQTKRMYNTHHFHDMVWNQWLKKLWY